jgi:SAM-dependent methyltransferase
MNPQPTWEELQPYYAIDYAPYRPLSASDLQKSVEKIRQTGRYESFGLLSSDRVLEIGPGGGSFLAVAQRVCRQAMGVEPSKEAVTVLRKQGCDVFHGQLEDFAKSYQGERFSLVFLSHVLEHMPQPRQALRAIRQLISPESRIVIWVPNAGSWSFRHVKGDWMGTDLPRHLLHWNKKAIQVLADQTGMAVMEMGFTSPVGVVEQSIAAYVQYGFRVPGKLVWLVPSLVGKIAEIISHRWLTPETAMNMEVVLRMATHKERRAVDVRQSTGPGA